MPIHADWKEMYSGMIKQYGAEKGKSVFYAYMNKHGYDETKPRPKSKEFLFVEGISYKEEGEDFFVEGFVSTADPDNNKLIGTGDLPELILNQQDLVNQLNSNSQAKLLSIHHDWIKGKGNRPIGIMIDQAELKYHPKTNKPGAFATFKLNKAHEGFNDTKSEIKDKIITGFSIEYDSNVPYSIQDINGKPTRVFDSVPLFGIGLASRGINPNAEILNWGVKEYLDYYEKNKLEEKMEKELVIPETPKVEIKEEKKIDFKEDPNYPDFLKFKDMQAKELAQKEFNERLKEGIKGLNIERPLFNKENFGATLLATKEGKEFDDSFKRYKEVVSSYAPIDLQWKAAGALVNKEMELARAGGYPNIRQRTQMAESVEEKYIIGNVDPNVRVDYTMGGYLSIKEGTFDEWGSPKMKQVPQGAYANKLGIKENLAYKDLNTDTNLAHASWTYGSYYMSPAELNDIFQPVIVNQLNNEINVWNSLQKVDFSGYSSIQFRAKSARNTTPSGFAEDYDFYGNASYTGAQGRIKLQQPFAYYYALVQVSGPEIELAKSPGGIGDVYADEVSGATDDLMLKLEQGIIGTGAGTSASVCLGFEGLIRTSGNLYGRDVTSSGPPDYTKLAAFEKSDMSAAPITLKKMRTMIDSACNNGAKETDLAFYCKRFQVTQIKTLIQNIQRIVPTSARVGFIGKAELDGVPIYDAVNINSDDLFLIDTAHTKIGMKVPPTYEETAKTHDARNGYIKIYFNVYSDAPNHNGWIYNLATS